MHPFINHELTLAREADQRRRAERDQRVNAVISRRPRRLSRVKAARVKAARVKAARVKAARVKAARLKLTRLPIKIARRTEMAKFMDVHSGFTGVTEDQLREAHQRDLDIEAAEGVHFERAWLDPRVARCSACPPGRPRRRYGGCTRRPGTPRTRSTSCRSRFSG
jgi:hypothetical protein